MSLEPVTYNITVEAPGFKKAMVNNIKVDTATFPVVNVKLEPGAAKEEVTITAEAPMINEGTGTPSQTVSERQLTDLPLNNRSVLDLAMTVANVYGDAGSEDPNLASTIPTPGYNIFINGGRAGSTNILADGARNTGVGLARAVVTFSPDSVQEFTVQTSNFSAEYGQSGGGIINMTTKSGTNKFNVNLNWYNRNPAFMAGTYTMIADPTKRPKSQLRVNQFGAIVSGPVDIPKIYDGHNKTFFFVAFEPRWTSDGAPSQPLLPTAAMRAGDFSNTVNISGGQVTRDIAAQFPTLASTVSDVVIYNQFTIQGTSWLRPTTMPAGMTTFPVFPNNVIPSSMIDPVSLKIQQHIPLPEGGYFINSSGTLANFNSTSWIRNREKRLTAKVDHQVTDNNRLSVRYTQVPIIAIKGSFDENADPVNGNGADYSYSKQILLSDTHTFGNKINEFRANYTRGRFSRNMPPTWDVYTGRNFSTEIGLPSITAGGLPSFAPGMGAYVGWSQSQQNENLEQTYNLTDNFSWVKGNMTWKFGVDLADERLKTSPMYSASGGRYEFNRNNNWTNSTVASGATGGLQYAQFLMGVPNLVTLRDSIFTYYYSWKSAAGFVQNDWKIHPNLTLNLGLRYQLQYPREEKNNMQAVFRPDLAKSYPLATPYTLPDGTVVTSALVPPMAFTGMGGRSKYMTPVDYNGWEPRIGFAWVPNFKWNKDKRLVVRGGYGLSHGTLTGMNRSASPDFGGSGTAFNGDTGGVNSATVLINGITYNNMMRLCCNQPNLVPKTPEQKLNLPADGLLWLDSINYQGNALVVSDNYKVPYIQSFSLSLSYQVDRTTVVEVAYSGNKGTHLFLPPVNINTRSFSLVNSFVAIGSNPNASVRDPLGRTLNGTVITVPAADIGGKYMGFSGLTSYLDSSSSSIRHGGYISVRRRIARGFTGTLNYTYAKSIDDASDSGGVRFTDFNIIRTNGQVQAGAPRSLDRSLSTFDIRHTFSATAVYDLPVGKGAKFFAGMPGWLDQMVGGWSLSGTGRVQQGTPLVVVVNDGNQLTTASRVIRPNIAPGVPFINPNWD